MTNEGRQTQPEKIINNQPVGRKCQGRGDKTKGEEKKESGSLCLHALRACQVMYRQRWAGPQVIN